MAKSGGGSEQEQRKPQRHGDGDEGDAPDSGQLQEKAAELKEDIDELLDEIDEVLEENAEEFVRSYVQKGGE